MVFCIGNFKAEVWAIKLIEIDIRTKSHSISTKGTFPIESFSTEGDNLHLSRPMVGHPHYCRLDAIIIPAKGVQVCRYHRTIGRDWFDWYIDIIDASHVDGHWYIKDLYVDVLLLDGVAYRVVDLDEMLDGYRQGMMTQQEFEWALSCLHSLCKELNDNDFRIGNLLAIAPII